MADHPVFAFDSYKALLIHRLTGEGQRGQISRAAEFLNCQRSYLSRVLSEEIHLTPDHAFHLANFLKFTEDERSYFLALVELDRAVSADYKAHLKTALDRLKRKYESIAERTQRQSLSVNIHNAAYFSSWIWSAIHFLTSVPRLQTAGALADHLGLKSQTVLSCLQELKDAGFVEKKGERWLYKAGEFHADKGSPQVLLHHQNWRFRALIDAQEFGNDSVHFTAVQTVNRSDAERIKALLLDFISRSSEIAGPSQPEEGVAIVCDFFRI